MAGCVVIRVKVRTRGGVSLMGGWLHLRDRLCVCVVWCKVFWEVNSGQHCMWLEDVVLSHLLC